MLVHFFSYGAFDQGQVHHSKISNFIVSDKPALIKGDMHLLRCGYPVLSYDPSKEFAEGRLVQLQVTESFWAILDQLVGFDPQRPEKSLLQRVEVPTRVDNYSQVAAFTYVLNPKKITSAHKKITGNDWRKRLLDNPPITSQLQQRQKLYIEKLSHSKGRDIVPIKMDLYRELMNLELIVDKGRRLALTPMGKEAALFL